jgi:hypothetical protein
MSRNFCKIQLYKPHEKSFICYIIAREQTEHNMHTSGTFFLANVPGIKTKTYKLHNSQIQNINSFILHVMEK